MASSEHQLIEMSSDGDLMLAAGGEALSTGYEFYAVFETPVDYRVLHGAHNLGTLPMDHVVAEGQTIIFAGRRWRVITVDDKARVILVQQTKAALLPTFGGNGGAIHDLVVEEMRLLLSGTDMPVYLNGTA